MMAFIWAVATNSLGAGLSAAMFTTSIILIVLFALPNLLWTGALTPILTNATITEARVLKIPQYSASSNTTWSDNARLGDDANTVINEKDIFSNCPVSILQSSLLSWAAQATLNLTQIHSKNDNSHYFYVSRSYGVSSPAGLIDENLYGGHNNFNLLSYNYTEPGYLTHVTCFYNASSTFHLKEIQAGKVDNGIPYIYYAIGLFPNAVSDQGADFFSVVSVNGNADIAVVAAKRYQSRNVILVTAGSNYIDLNSTQCEVSLALTMFTVSVDVVNKFVSVLPLITIMTAGFTSPSFDPTSGLTDTVMNQINGLGMISTSLYISVVSNALMTNIKAATTNITNTSFTYPPTAFAAMADSFSVMIDDILLFVASSQFYVPNASGGDFFTVDAHLTVQAIRLGEAEYVITTFIMCVVLLAAVMIEACRTRGWRWLPRWDFMNTACLALASAVTGEDLVGEMCRGQEGGRIEWTGGDLSSWGKGRGQGVRKGDGQDEVPGFRLRLGRKVFRATPAQQARDGDGNAKGGQEVQLATVSLRTSDAKDVVPLI